MEREIYHDLYLSSSVYSSNSNVLGTQFSVNINAPNHKSWPFLCSSKNKEHIYNYKWNIPGKRVCLIQYSSSYIFSCSLQISPAAAVQNWPFHLLWIPTIWRWYCILHIQQTRQDKVLCDLTTCVEEDYRRGGSKHVRCG